MTPGSLSTVDVAAMSFPTRHAGTPASASAALQAAQASGAALARAARSRSPSGVPRCAAVAGDASTERRSSMRVAA